MNKRRLISALLVFSLILSVFSMTIPVLAEDEGKALTVIHVNDTHGRAEENEDNGELGYAKLKTFVDSKDPDSTLLLDAGDTIHGTTFATISRGESMVSLMNDMGFDAMAPGNHDFNYGYERLKELEGNADFPILAANVKDEDADAFGNHIIKEVDGIKVGIFGLATPETRTKSNPLNTKGLTFEDYIETAKAEVEALEAEEVDVIIALVHLGIDDSSVERSDILAEKVDGIDLIIDGHSHSSLPEGKKVGDTLIAQTGGHINEVGEVVLSFDDANELVDAKATLHDYDELKDLEPNADILEAIDEVVESNEPYLAKVVGVTEVDLDGVRENVRTKETNLGNLITDAMLDVSGADVALTNGGGIREPIPKGEITMKHILTTFPFTNYPVVLEITGADLLAALEHGVDAAPEPAGKFPQVAGMSFKFDPEQEAGNRVFDVKVGEEDLDLEKTYKLVTNDFMAVGGDGYEMFDGLKKIAEYPLLSEILADYIEEAETIAPEVEGRIVEEAKAEVEDPEVPDELVFTDIEDHWAKDVIIAMTEKGYFKGMTETTFEPNTKINRAMVVTTLARLEEAEASEDVENPFSDVEAEEWYTDAVLWASEEGIVEGYEDGTFKPLQEVTREEMATIIGRYLDYKEIDHADEELADFEDQDEISDWALEGLETARLAGIIEGRDGNVFDPKAGGTRAELAKIIYELDALLEAQEAEEPIDDEEVIDDEEEPVDDEEAVDDEEEPVDDEDVEVEDEGSVDDEEVEDEDVANDEEVDETSEEAA